MLIQNPREPQNPRYDLTTIWLHWAPVGLIAVLWVIGQTADWVPRGPFRTGLWSIHVILGGATGLVLLTRALGERISGTLCRLPTPEFFIRLQ